MLKVKSDKPVDPYVLDVLEHVQAVSDALGIRCFMIGARAIDVQLHNVHGLRTFHPTSDTDFAVAVGSWEKFAALKAGLVKTGHFTADIHAAHRLSFNGGFPVDLVPFGGVERPKGNITWPADSMKMAVQCFEEISAAAEEVEIRDGLVSRVASLPGLMLMKVFAWGERGGAKDAWNIASLLQNYNTVVDEASLFADEDVSKALGFDVIKVGAALLGVDAAVIATAAGLEAARRIVSRGMETGSLPANIGGGLAIVEGDNRISTAEELLRAFLLGFKK